MSIVIPRRIKSWINNEQLWIKRLVRWLRWAVRMRVNKGICSIEIASNTVGFFALLVWYLHLLQYCERHRLVPDIRLTGDSYLDPRRGPNWFQYYFDARVGINAEEAARRVQYTKKIHRWSELGPPFHPKLSLEEGARIFHKYLCPKPHINKIVNDFWEAMGAKGPVVGVHFRGTDHIEEAPRVSYEHCLNVLKNYLHAHQDVQAVFVASDEQAFIDFIKNSMKGNVSIFCHEDHYRSNDSNNHRFFEDILEKAVTRKAKML